MTGGDFVFDDVVALFDVKATLAASCGMVACV